MMKLAVAEMARLSGLMFDHQLVLILGLSYRMAITSLRLRSCGAEKAVFPTDSAMRIVK